VILSLLSNDGKLLNQESIAEMLKPQLEAAAKASLADSLTGEWGPFFNMGTSGPTPDWGLGGLLVTSDDDDSGLGEGTITWGGGVNSAWFIDSTNEICGFVCLQLGIPADIMKGMELKAVFRKHLKEQLRVED
jgi:CubicO group peptidase (beta-lactamase class C family)